ncbi:MAG TPA: ABC transporter permease [Steroidobacteraceae bacterium]|nr:ABC transporter permease [Steroidobacteraceae bacterium]
MLLEVNDSGARAEIALRGDWVIDNVAEIERSLRTVPSGARHITLNPSDIHTLDLSGAWMLRSWLDRLKVNGIELRVAGELPAHFAFIDELLERPDDSAPSAARERISLASMLAWVGRFSHERAEGAIDALGYLGRFVVSAVRSLRSAHNLRVPSVARHVYETGIQAIPIVGLIAFLISVIVAYLGAQQLRQFGADIFTVDLVAISVLRELGVLLTSIIVAGRSGSAFAAEIGVMRLNDEIDALESMGVDFFEVLVLPRVIGLVIALPLLTVIADAMGLAGGAVLSSWLLDIPLSQYIPRVQEAIAPTTFWAGLIKAPVFAILIAMVGTLRGMQVRDSSRELGRLTTIAVVQSIFLVIFADAIFAVVYVELDF